MQKEGRNHEDEIERILKDPKKYRKMMLIMQQTLYDLGYHESAKMLENQSGINYYSSELLSIKQLLEKDDFEGAIKVVEQLEKEAIKQQEIKEQQMNGQKSKINCIKLTLPALEQAKVMIYETYCMHKIISKEFQAAMQIISENIKNQAKKEFLCQALVLGNHHLSPQQLQKKKQGIFKFCLSSWQQIGEKQIQKVIESYRQNQGDFKKEVKGLLSEQKLQPPMRIWSVQLQKDIKHAITHMKLSLTLDSLYLIQEDRDLVVVHLISIDDKKMEYMRHCIDSGYGETNKRQMMLSKRISKTLQIKYKGKSQSVESIALNPNPQDSYVSLALCTFNTITILNVDFQVLCQIESNNKIQKYLHIDFHPVSQLLYACGYFETLNVIDSSGQLIQSVYPFPKTRKFLFSDNNHTIGISLVTNKIYKHTLDEQTLEKEIELDDGVLPMDLCISNKNNLIGVMKENKNLSNKQGTLQYLAISSLQFIYILDSNSLNILGKTTSPTNPNKLVVQVNFYNHYLITLAKNFTSYTIQSDPTSMKDESQQNGTMIQQSEKINIVKNKEWIGQGTFIVDGNFMMSGYKEVIVWGSGETESQMMDQSLEEGLNDYMIEQLPVLSEEDMNSDNSLNSNAMEQDQNSDESDEEQEQNEQLI